MSYKYTFNNDNNYLAHFNKNHSKANGQFISGDGDDDGVIDDHHNYSRNKRGVTSGSETKGEPKPGIFSPRRKMSSTERKIGVAVGLTAAALGAAAMFVSVRSKRTAGEYGSSASSGANWLEAGELYKASKAKVVGGDW